MHRYFQSGFSITFIELLVIYIYAYKLYATNFIYPNSVGFESQKPTLYTFLCIVSKFTRFISCCENIDYLLVIGYSTLI